MKNKKTYQEVDLAAIQTNPLNPRKSYAGPKYEELTASIRKVGVIEPILLRPLTDDSGKYEIVAGERRYRAACQIAKDKAGIGDEEQGTIPAVIQNMTDDDAFELMTIENLQREDLTELEEAHSFKNYLDRKGKDALPELATRTGINPRYIQRRITVLQLPAKVLKAWEAGKIKYGHCEQLCRLKDEKRVMKHFNDLFGRDDYVETILDLKEMIDNEAAPLQKAKFNLDEAGCRTCRSNSEVQRELFNESVEGVCCFDPACFIEKQREWLSENWKKYGKNFGTNGFRFGDGIEYNKYEVFDITFSGAPGEKCKECAGFVSLLFHDGKAKNKQACIGDKKCFNAVIAAGKVAKNKKKAAKSGAGKGDAAAGDETAGQPRVSWHGEFFREEFYKTTIPERIGKLTNEFQPEKILRFSLLSLLIANSKLKERFAVRWMKDKFHLDDEGTLLNQEDEDCSPWEIKFKDIWERLSTMKGDDLLEAHRDAAGEAILQRVQTPPAIRHYVALHLGIDLKSEWRLHKEYLEKKTITEILTLLNKLGIAKDKKALTYLAETLNKKPGRFDTCKKQELIAVILESGVDLAGKVPEEILKVDPD